MEINGKTVTTEIIWNIFNRDESNTCSLFVGSIVKFARREEIELLSIFVVYEHGWSQAGCIHHTNNSMQTVSVHNYHWNQLYVEVAW